MKNKQEFINFIFSMLNDDNGINEQAFDRMLLFIRSEIGENPDGSMKDEDIQFILNNVDSCEGRFYLHEEFDICDNVAEAKQIRKEMDNGK